MNTVERLLEKSKEAFTLAIEIYNKPTIHYRLEGFSFFICNAWELMLKAHLINQQGEQAIYYPDKPNRTISLENCIQRIFTNEKSPIRLNFDKIIELRNTSTHFITEEYEMVYIPLLQACVFNFVEKMNEFHSIDMTEIIPENFITLSVKVRALSETEIRAKYSSAVSERLIHTQQTLQSMIAENNSGFAIRVEHWYYQTKRRGEATDTFYIDREASDGVRIISKLKDPSESHKYNAKSCIAEINKRLKREGVMPMYRGETTEINNFHFNNFVRYFGLKTDERYCYIHRIDTNQVRYTYSIQAIDFIVDELQKAPDRILDDLKQKTQKS